VVDVAIRKTGSVKYDFLETYVCSASSNINVIYHLGLHGGTSFGLVPILGQIISKFSAQSIMEVP
jgi:hypothetical protein